MDSTGPLSFGYSLYSMDTGLAFECFQRFFTCDFGKVATELAEFPTAFCRKPAVHAEKIIRKDIGFCSSGTGSGFENYGFSHRFSLTLLKKFFQGKRFLLLLGSFFSLLCREDFTAGFPSNALLFKLFRSPFCIKKGFFSSVERVAVGTDFNAKFGYS